MGKEPASQIQRERSVEERLIVAVRDEWLHGELHLNLTRHWLHFIGRGRSRMEWLLGNFSWPIPSGQIDRHGVSTPRSTKGHGCQEPRKGEGSHPMSTGQGQSRRGPGGRRGHEALRISMLETWSWTSCSALRSHARKRTPTPAGSELLHLTIPTLRCRNSVNRGGEMLLGLTQAVPTIWHGCC